MSTSAKGRGAAPIRHESVLALLAAHPGETDAKKLIRRLAQAKVAYARSHGWTGPPFCPKLLASIFGIRCREVGHDIGGDGRLLLYPDGKPWIEFRSGRLHERQRFTIFHEFAHTLFPDYCQFVRLHNPSPKKQRDPEKEFEFLCDLAASEMLLPHEEFHSDVAGVKLLCFEAIHDLRQRYQASIDATTHRLIEIEPTIPCAALFLTDQGGNYTGRGPLWVKYACHSAQFKGFIQPGVQPPPNSIVVNCFKNGVETTQFSRETWWVYGRPRTWRVQAAKLPVISENLDYPKVLALLLPSAYGRTHS